MNTYGTIKKKKKGFKLMKYKFKNYSKSSLMRNHLNLGGASPSGERIDVTSLYLERGKKPWIGIMGEYHFSRDKKENWPKELCKMKAGGITAVATYLFWIYHEEEEGFFDFSGDLDIRAFILECKKAGLDVVIRIGPWAHGECRNGGFPDWLMKKPYKLRDNNDEYMAKAALWYNKIYEQVKGLFFSEGGNIIAVQLENELTDGAEHLAALKNIAIEIGFDVPIFTVTGWNSAAGAKIPVDEVMPVFGGYIEAPWEKHTKQLMPSSHYFFNLMRNDSAIGTDLIAETADDGWQLPYERYPFATCELGGGIQVTHHRRPIIKGMDIYALSLVKLGCGNNLIGYYMYHGGTNKIGKHSTFNESKATGYPNDYPILSYDFQAPLSEYGEVREQYRMLNLLHMFVNDFGDILAPMEAVESENAVNRNDTSSLRYCMRTDGNSGFVFVNHYQRLTQLKDIHNAVIETNSVTFPPIDVCGDICFFMPFNMNLSGNILTYATAQPLCRIDDTYFFVSINGIKPEYCFGEKTLCDNFTFNNIKVVTLDFEQALYARKLSGMLYIGDKCDLYEYENKICSAGDGDYSYTDILGNSFNVSKPFKPASVTITPTEQPFEPAYDEELNIDGKRNISWTRLDVDSDSGFIELNYMGDAAQIYADGKLVADDYYYGKPWRIPAKLLFGKECYMAVSEMRDDFYREF